jgi:hypothetical protein
MSSLLTESFCHVPLMIGLRHEIYECNGRAHREACVARFQSAMFPIASVT